MSVLQRQIEAQGVCTVSISLYKEFTRRVQPPRALWVPFPFGRPLGAPNDKAIQRKVIMAALDLMSRDSGPVLEDFVLAPEEEHLDARNQTVGSKCSAKGCNFDEALSSPDEAPQPAERPQIPAYDDDVNAIAAELWEHRPAFEAYRAKSQGRTQVGHSGLEPNTVFEAAKVLHRYLRGDLSEIPARAALPRRDSLNLDLFVRLNADDLKTYFMEARLGMSEGGLSDTGDFNEWFWFSTRTAALIKAARDRMLEHTDREKDPYCVVARGMVPRGYGEDRRMNPPAEASAAPATPPVRVAAAAPQTQRIVVYHGDSCSACHAEMEFLSASGIDFVRKNVSRDAQARQELLKLGSRTVPTTVIDNEVIVGFEKDRLQQLLKL